MNQLSEATIGNDKAPAPTVSYLEAVRALGLGASHEDAVANIVQRGLESAVLDRLYELGAEQNEVHRALAFPDRGTLTPGDTAIVIRIAHTLCRAIARIGNRAEALAWLRTPQARLDGQTPLAAAVHSDRAVSEVEACLPAE